MVPICGGASGELISLPAYNNKRAKNGIMAKIDCRWIGDHGYRPIRVTLMVRKTNRDRTVRVVLLPESRYRRDPLAVSADVEVPQGEREVTKTIYVPQQRPWSSFRAEFHEDGRKLKDLSMVAPYRWNNSYNTEAPCLLMVDSDAPQIADDHAAVIRQLRRKKSRTLPDAARFSYLTNGRYSQPGDFIVDSFDDRGRLDDAAALEIATTTPNLALIAPNDLPTDRIGLSGIDVIVVSLIDLTEVSANYPKRFEAIDFFVRAGGNLIVFDETEADEQASQLMGHTGTWHKANRTLFRRKLDASYRELLDNEEAERGQPTTDISQDAPDFRWTLHGMGKIVAIDSVDPYDQPAIFWQWVIREIGFDRLTWTDRHGISLVQNNNSYWDFMIPGFGASPVGAFLAVISVFILCIGPLNYFVLNKSKRLYLLPITVGIAALLTTFVMMSYAIVSDGLTTRVRLHSFTLLDQQNVEHIATTYCRQSYLAAFSPSQGLIFPAHTCVYPVLPLFDDSLEREEAINDRKQQRVLSRGYMQARSTMQFLTTDVQATEHGVEITDGKGEQTVTAKNNMGVALTHAWICDAEGVIFQALDVQADQTLDLNQIDSEQALVLFNKLAAASRPAPPPGLDKAATYPVYGFGRYRNFRSRPIYAENSLLRQQMNDLPSFFKKPTPNTYLVVSEMGPSFVHQGTKAKEEAGFHVMRGKW